MHPGKACRHHWATRGAVANAAVVCRSRRTICPLIFKQLSGRPTSPSVAASLKHHLRLLRPLVEYNLLVLPSVPDSDPIMNVSTLDHSRCNQQRLGTCSFIMWCPQRRPPGRRSGH